MWAVLCGLDAEGVTASTLPLADGLGADWRPSCATGRRRRLATRPRRPRGRLLREPHDDFETTARDVALGRLLLLFVQDDEEDDGRLARNPSAFREAQLHLFLVNRAPSSSEGPSRDDDDDGDGGATKKTKKTPTTKKNKDVVDSSFAGPTTAACCLRQVPHRVHPAPRGRRRRDLARHRQGTHRPLRALRRREEVQVHRARAQARPLRRRRRPPAASSAPLLGHQAPHVRALPRPPRRLPPPLLRTLG